MRIRGTMITIMLLAAAALLAASSATSQAICSASGLAQATLTPGLSGYVYAGDMGDESTPLNNVTVELYCSNNVGQLGTHVASTTTNTEGWYDLPIPGICEYYNILETDPPDYASVGATAIGGRVVTSNWIEYALPLGGKTLTDNRFWDRSDPQVEALRQLETNSQRPPYIHFDGGIPRFVAVQVAVPDTLPNDPVVRAVDFLERYKGLYRLADPRFHLYLNRITSDDREGQHLFFGQHRDGIPVFAAELAVHLEGDDVAAINGNYLSEIPPFPPPTLTAAEAQAAALEDVPGTDVEPIGETKLMIFNQSLFAGGQAETHLAWRMMLRGRRTSDGLPTWWSYFVDAHDGEILLGLEEEFTGDRPGEDFDIETGNHDTSTSCWIMTTSDDQWFDEDGPTSDYPGGPGNYPGGDTDGDNAFDFTHQTYHYFYDNFDRRSYDGDEEDVEVYVHRGVNWPNSYYDMGCDIFEFGDGRVVRDIFAHEFTHGVTHSTAGLIYADEPGALNESYSDVFGAMVDDDDWTIGEDLISGTVRSMNNPPLFVHPDHVDPTISGDGQGLRPPPPGSDRNQANDWGSVHTNSGIPNKVAFLIAQGAVHNGIMTFGIGRPKTGRLYYDVLTTRLAKNAQLLEARNETVEQARAYVRDKPWPPGDVRNDFTTTDVCDVINAFASVGLGPPDTDCDGQDNFEDTDDDGDHILDGQDNCRNVFNPGQENTDGDGQGDACDDDDDNDGRLDQLDNCPLTPNPNQLDDDFDGIGDVCDDDDGDGVMNPEDNCRFDPNFFQEDTDGDGDGDACDLDDDNDGVPDSNPDNCRLTPNPNQTDTDGDNVGDACDNCRETPNPDQTNTDGVPNVRVAGDDLGDACDPDIDNDGILNDDDNCPGHYNPWQIDLDGNGKGTQCDPNELASLVPPNVVDGKIQFGGDIVRIPIFPCLQCPDWLPENYRTQVEVSLPLDLPMRIVDDQGFVVNKSGPGLDKVLHFYPSADYFYRPPGGMGGTELKSAQASVYQGRSYFLEIYRSPEVEIGQDYAIRIGMVSGEAKSPSAYLPMIFKHHAPGPDLVVESLVATSNAVTVTIKNQGNVLVTDAFWVDVYFNPTETPGVNKPWDTIASYGVVWGVTASIPADGSLTLTTGGDYYFPQYSSTPPLPVGADVYALVDSINHSTTYGNVLESNEDNNLLGPVTSTAGVAGEGTPIGQGQPLSMEGLPPR
jgi:Zn-dependent metalloprotease